MGDKEKPLTEAISSLKQVSESTPVEGESKGTGSSKSFVIVVSILVVLIAIMGGIYIYNQGMGDEGDTGDTQDEEVSAGDEVSFDQVRISVPDERGGVATNFELYIPSSWEVSEGESSTVITDGTYSVSLTKNPVITGGGWGFMYPGYTGYEIESMPFNINDEEVKKVVHIYDTDVVGGSEKVNIWGGTVYASASSKDATPTLKLDGVSYSIRCFLNGDEPVSIDDAFFYFDELMDIIVESIRVL